MAQRLKREHVSSRHGIPPRTRNAFILVKTIYQVGRNINLRAVMNRSSEGSRKTHVFGKLWNAAEMTNHVTERKHGQHHVTQYYDNINVTQANTPT